MLKRATIIFLLLAVFSLKNEAQEQGQIPSTRELMDIVIKKALENNRIKARSLIFEKRYMIEDLNIEGRPGSIKKDATTLEGKGRPGAEVPIDINRVLTTSYMFSYASPAIQIIDNRPHYVVHFEPLPENPEVKGLFYEVANRSEGTLYIDREHFFIRKMNSRLIRSFNKYLYLGRVRRVELEFQQEFRPDLNNLVVIKSIIAVVRYRVIYLLYPVEYFEKYTYSYSNYKLVQ
jgi:hypothetical protein